MVTLCNGHKTQTSSLIIHSPTTSPSLSHSFSHIPPSPSLSDSFICPFSHLSTSPFHSLPFPPPIFHTFLAPSHAPTRSPSLSLIYLSFHSPASHTLSIRDGDTHHASRSESRSLGEDGGVNTAHAALFLGINKQLNAWERM